MNSSLTELKARLTEIEPGRTVYLGIGNILRGDDGIGPRLAAKLSGMGMKAVDAGTVPENHIRSMARLEPDTVIIIDAVHLERDPGSVELLEKEDIAGGTGFTTHTLSPVLVMERLEAETGAEVLLLAIQPRDLGFGVPMSREMEELLVTLPEILARPRQHQSSD